MLELSRDDFKLQNVNKSKTIFQFRTVQSFGSWRLKQPQIGPKCYQKHHGSTTVLSLFHHRGYHGFGMLRSRARVEACEAWCSWTDMVLFLLEATKGKSWRNNSTQLEVACQAMPVKSKKKRKSDLSGLSHTLAQYFCHFRSRNQNIKSLSHLLGKTLLRYFPPR